MDQFNGFRRELVKWSKVYGLSVGLLVGLVQMVVQMIPFL